MTAPQALGLGEFFSTQPGRPGRRYRSMASTGVAAHPFRASASAIWMRVRRPPPPGSTSSGATGIPAWASRSSIRWLRRTRSSRCRVRKSSSAGESGRMNRPTMCTSQPAWLVESSTPGTTRTPSASPAARPSSSPATESWSVMATAPRPVSLARETSSPGVSVPSEAVVWV